METTFKYNGKIITTPNLEKKLKRMKLTLEDIEIIETPIKVKQDDNGIEEYMLNKELVVIRSTEDSIRRICYVPKGIRPPITEFLKHHYKKEELEKMYYEV